MGDGTWERMGGDSFTIERERKNEQHGSTVALRRGGRRDIEV